MCLATLKPSALTHICANYTYNHVLYDVCTQTGCINVQTINYKLPSPGGPIPQNMARALMPRQPYSVAVPSDEEERLHPLPFWKGRGLGSGLRTLPQGEGQVGHPQHCRAVSLFFPEGRRSR
jgi:hypothetical protein